MRHRFLLLLLPLMLLPRVASAQIDAIIDAVVDAVEPTPVYDSGLKNATEDLADKIDRLNRALFGGAEENTAAYRYRNMYSELYDLTTTFSNFVDRSYSNAQRLDRLYSRLDQDSPRSYAYLAQDTWGVYESTIRDGSRIVAKFKKLFSDNGATNAEVREQARESIEEILRSQAAEDRRIEQEIVTTEIAEGLAACADFMTPSVKEYVEEGKRTYGTSLDPAAAGGGRTGTLGTAVMIIIGLLCSVYALFAGIQIMKGTPNAESMISRLLILIVISLVIILSIQTSI